MSLLILAYRQSQLIQRLSDLTLRMMERGKRLVDLSKYSSSISDGSVSMNDLMTCPPSMFNRMSIFMKYSNDAAISGAQQKFGIMVQAGVIGMALAQVNPAQQEAYKQYMFQNLYNQEREKFAEQVKKQVNLEEEKLKKEDANDQIEYKMLEAEKSKLDEQVSKEAQNSAPKYGS